MTGPRTAAAVPVPARPGMPAPAPELSPDDPGHSGTFAGPVSSVVTVTVTSNCVYTGGRVTVGGDAERPVQ